MLLGMEEAAMEQVSVLVYGEVMEENGKPWKYWVYLLVVGEYTFWSVCSLGLEHDLAGRKTCDKIW